MLASETVSQRVRGINILIKVCTYRNCNNPIPENRKYCSLQCSYKEKGLLSRKPSVTGICKNPKCSLVFIIADKSQLYCSMSCAAQYNNSKRVVPKFCKTCASSISHKGKYCDNCRYKNTTLGEDYAITTIGDLKTRYGRSEYHAKLRGNSRSVYLKSGRPLKCLICGYSKHVDICHVVPISEFPQDTPVSKVNAISNLMALCKNHHWEFDNNSLSNEDSALLLSLHPPLLTPTQTV